EAAALLRQRLGGLAAEVGRVGQQATRRVVESPDLGGERCREPFRDRRDTKRRLRRAVPVRRELDRSVHEQPRSNRRQAGPRPGVADDLCQLSLRNRASHAVFATLPATQARLAVALAQWAGPRETNGRRGRMALTKEAKQELITKHGRTEADTGSPQVQIAMLTQRINELTEHLRTHRHDHYSRRGLLKLVGRRRRFLNYLQKHNLEGYRALIKELGLRR